MNRTSSLRFVVPLLIILPVGFKTTSWLLRPGVKANFDAEMSREGQELFAHEWTPNDPLASEGDGLGPVFNAKSCAACHKQGAIGGGGPIENNVTSFIRRTAATPDNRQGTVHMSRNCRRISGKSGVRRPGPAVTQPSDSRRSQSADSAQLLRPSDPSLGPTRGNRPFAADTPALFGANFIDAIPARLIIANERMEKLKWGPGRGQHRRPSVGRALRLSNGQVGKLGWKAQVGTLSDFVRGRLRNKLGLAIPARLSPFAQQQELSRSQDWISPTSSATGSRLSFASLSGRSTQPRLTEEAHNTSQERPPFTRSVVPLPHGRPRRSQGALQRHAAAPDGTRPGRRRDLWRSAGRRSAFRPGDGPDPSEWRTPPLWGVADSGLYLHDGLRRHVKRRDQPARRPGEQVGRSLWRALRQPESRSDRVSQNPSRTAVRRRRDARDLIERSTKPIDTPKHGSLETCRLNSPVNAEDAYGSPVHAGAAGESGAPGAPSVVPPCRFPAVATLPRQNFASRSKAVRRTPVSAVKRDNRNLSGRPRVDHLGRRCLDAAPSVTLRRPPKWVKLLPKRPINAGTTRLIFPIPKIPAFCRL